MAVNSQVVWTSIVPFSLRMRLQVSLDPLVFCCAGDGSSSCPESRILWRPRKQSLGFPRHSASPIPPPNRGCGFPHCLGLPVWPAMDHRVSSNLASYRWLCRASLGFPRHSAFQRRLSMEFRVAPNLASSGLPTVSFQVSLKSRPSGSALGTIAGSPRY
jgi:hypothetical protein